ncbi:Vacuolar protein sorting-associated protein 45 [Smittium culicis]|uniref:Vacuolar protein sorting-associated protein 45 n=1 Tax=Smittium culicis TaxID=133412 RepID=A0A1R1YDZ3_9FUNG|nr:Vacuolar protein sorting-associated protein 45 [Smittium culicis]
MFSLGMSPSNYPLFDKPDVWNNFALQRASQGLLSLFLSLKQTPIITRYEANSNMAYQLAKELNYQIGFESSLFSFKNSDPQPVLLILDRKNDPVTPLLKQWTYQPMIHDLFGINNGRVDLSRAPNIKPEYKEIVLSTENDDFFNKSMRLNFGDLGVSIKNYVNAFQDASKSNQKLDSIDDMKKFVENYPEFRKLSGNVSKHVTLVSELSRVVNERSLLYVSELEQSLACDSNNQFDEHMKQLGEMIGNNKIRSEEKVCCTLLFLLRYEKSASIANASNFLKQELLKHHVSQDSIDMIDVVLMYASYKYRQGDLFNNDNIFSRGKQALKRGLQGVENVYTQHTPFYVDNLVKLIKENKPNSKIEQLFKLLPTNNSEVAASKLSYKARNRLIIVFFIGGITYSEHNDISKIKSQLGSEYGINLIVGGTSIINSKMFLQNLNNSFFS